MPPPWPTPAAGTNAIRAFYGASYTQTFGVSIPLLGDINNHAPVLPISGSGEAAFQPIWSHDVGRCVIAALERKEDAARYDLAGPETLTYEQMGRLIARSVGRGRPVVKVPLNLVRLGLRAVRRVAGDAAFATWEEAELMEVPMVSPRGDADVRALGVEPRRMEDVLG